MSGRGFSSKRQAVDRAEEECAGDEDQRRRLREKAAERRNALDQKFIQSFAKSVRNQFPSMSCGSGIRDRQARLPEILR
jgi:hypothetical protein